MNIVIAILFGAMCYLFLGILTMAFFVIAVDAKPSVSTVDDDQCFAVIFAWPIFIPLLILKLATFISPTISELIRIPKWAGSAWVRLMRNLP